MSSRRGRRARVGRAVEAAAAFEVVARRFKDSARAGLEGQTVGGGAQQARNGSESGGRPRGQRQRQMRMCRRRAETAHGTRDGDGKKTIFR